MDVKKEESLTNVSPFKNDYISRKQSHLNVAIVCTLLYSETSRTLSNMETSAKQEIPKPASDFPAVLANEMSARTDCFHCSSPNGTSCKK